METRYCLECGEPLHGRADKKFCSDQCRTTYHNRLHAESNQYIRRINAILKKNRNILATLNPGGKAKVPKEKLLSHGYNFNYHTNIYETRSGSRYYFCYDMGYLPLDNGMYFLVHRQEYIG